MNEDNFISFLMWMHILMNVYLHSLYEISTLRLVRLKGEPFERSENQRTSLELIQVEDMDTLPLSNHRYKIL